MHVDPPHRSTNWCGGAHKAIQDLVEVLPRMLGLDAVPAEMAADPAFQNMVRTARICTAGYALLAMRPHVHADDWATLMGTVWISFRIPPMNSLEAHRSLGDFLVRAEKYGYATDRDMFIQFANETAAACSPPTAPIGELLWKYLDENRMRISENIVRFADQAETFLKSRA